MAAQRVIHRSGDQMYSERSVACVMMRRDTNSHSQVQVAALGLLKVVPRRTPLRGSVIPNPASSLQAERQPATKTLRPSAAPETPVKVEVAGIEPASSSDEPGLLRAQLARRSLGSCARASTSQTSPAPVHFPAKP
jgi:hypothetical protein